METAMKTFRSNCSGYNKNLVRELLGEMGIVLNTQKENMEHIAESSGSTEKVTPPSRRSSRSLPTFDDKDS
eukprot:11667855-Heterocapsa_arctica.AAC.1